MMYLSKAVLSPMGLAAFTLLLGVRPAAPAAGEPDLVVSRDAGASAIVVPDSACMDAADWAKLPEHPIQVYAPEKMNMVYLGARLLQAYLAKSTGRELPVIAELEWEQRGAPPAIVVGPTRLTVKRLGARIAPANLKRSGYVIQSQPGRLLVCGADDWGAYSGCAALLEDYGGVQWYWPTELGEEVPSRPEWVFDRLDITFEPAIAFMASGLNPEGNTWAVRLGLRPLEWDFGHSLGPDIFHAGHATRPEWFPLLDGRRSVPAANNNVFNWQPCMGAPAALERALTMALRHFSTHPGKTGFSMGTNDGVWRGCECGYCRALDGPADPAFDLAPYHYNGRYSARYFAMLSRTADALQAEFPGKLVAGWAYAGADLPPADARPNPHLAVNVIGTKLAWLNPELRKWEELRLRRWSRVAGHLASYDYMYQTGYIPIYTPHLHAEVVRTLQREGVTSAYAELYPTIARSGPRYWVHIKMCLDPSQSVDALLDRWMRGMFKEAAAPMAEFYDTIEQCWVQYPYHERHTDGWGTYCFTGGSPLPVITPQALATLDACLAQAESLATDGRVKVRLAVVRKNYVPTRACAEALWRQRPFMDPVPFDDPVVLRDLKDHVAAAPMFDAPAHYAEFCRPDPLSWMFPSSITAIDTPAKRLGRVMAGLLDKPLTDTMAAADYAPDAVRAAVATRLDAMAAAAGASPAQTAELAALAGKLVLVPKVDSAPRLDGQTDDACWQALNAYRGFLVTGGEVSTATTNARHETSFRIGHDERHFYVAVTCTQPPTGLVAKAKDRADPAVGRDDRVVLSLCPWQYRHSGGSGHVDITVTAGGVVTENGAGYGTAYWHAGTRAVSRVTETGYVLEIAVPFKALLFSPQHTSRLQFNLRRIVTGSSAEDSAWFPAEMGTTFACVMQADARRLLLDFDRSTTLALTGGEVVEPVEADRWDAYVVEAPSIVRFPEAAGQPAQVTGNRMLLIGKPYLSVQPGHEYDVAADSRGAGTAVPSLAWYRRVESGYEDVLETGSGNEAPAEAEAGEAGWRRVCVRLAAPSAADAARLRLMCNGEVQVAAVRLIPRLPLEIRVDLDTDADRLVTGHVLGLQATVRNLSAKPIEGLRARLAYPWGVDRRAEAVSIAPRLNPGESSGALWWLTPVYAVGQAEFVIVVEAEGIPRLVTKVRGPVPAVQ